MAMSLTLMGNQPRNQVSQRWLRMAATMATIWTTVLSLPRSRGLDGEAFAGGDGAEAADQELAADDEDGDPGLHDVGVVGHEEDEGGGDHELVGEGVEEHAEGGDLAAAAGEVAVEAVGDRGGDEEDGGDDFLLAVGAALPGKAWGEGPDQQRDACDAGQRYGVGQIHGMGGAQLRPMPRILPFSHKGRDQRLGDRDSMVRGWLEGDRGLWWCRQLRGPSAAPLGRKLRAASLRMTLLRQHGGRRMQRERPRRLPEPFSPLMTNH